MSELMTVKEYAKKVDADPRTVRGWMRDDLLRFIRPDGHRARLIDSAQPRPKKKITKSDNSARQSIKPVANIPRQIYKRPANVVSRPCERTARPPNNPVFEKTKLKPLRLESVKHKAVSLEPVSDDSDDSDNWLTFKRLIGIGMLLWALPKLIPKILSQIK